MSPTSSQQWTRRIRYSDQNIRVSDADRNAVAELLTQHYAEGRLDQGEFDERVGRTMAAKTRGDLAGLFDDLPEPGSAAASGPGSSAGPGETAVPYRARGRRGGMLRMLLIVVLALICASVAWHAFTSLFLFGPLFWAFVVIAVIVLLTRSHRH
jgi:Domain of unknown function (DUF1707)